MNEQVEKYAAEHFFAEFRRKQELDGRAGESIRFAALLAAPLIGLISSIKLPLDGIEVLLLITAFVTALILVVSIGFAFRSYTGHKYEHPSTPQEMETWVAETKELGYKGRELSRLTSATINTNYVKCASLNAHRNDDRSRQISIANRLLGIVLVFLVIGGGMWGWNRVASTSAQPIAER